MTIERTASPAPQLVRNLVAALSLVFLCISAGTAMFGKHHHLITWWLVVAFGLIALALLLSWTQERATTRELRAALVGARAQNEDRSPRGRELDGLLVDATAYLSRARNLPAGSGINVGPNEQLRGDLETWDAHVRRSLRRVTDEDTVTHFWDGLERPMGYAASRDVLIAVFSHAVLRLQEMRDAGRDV